MKNIKKHVFIEKLKKNISKTFYNYENEHRAERGDALRLTVKAGWQSNISCRRWTRATRCITRISC